MQPAGERHDRYGENLTTSSAAVCSSCAWSPTDTQLTSTPCSLFLSPALLALSLAALSLSLSPSLSLSDSNSSLPPPLCLTGFPPSPLSFNSQQRVSHRQCARRRSCPPQHAPPPFVPPDYSPLWTPACLRQGKRRSQRRPPPAEEKRRREGFISSPGAVLEAIASWRPFFAFSFSHRRRLHCTAALTLPVRSPFSRLSSSVQCLR